MHNTNLQINEISLKLHYFIHVVIFHFFYSYHEIELFIVEPKIGNKLA